MPWEDLCGLRGRATQVSSRVSTALASAGFSSGKPSVWSYPGEA